MKEDTKISGKKVLVILRAYLAEGHPAIRETQKLIAANAEDEVVSPSGDPIKPDSVASYTISPSENPDANNMITTV